MYYLPGLGSKLVKVEEGFSSLIYLFCKPCHASANWNGSSICKRLRKLEIVSVLFGDNI